jgi:hypothetical protein
MSDILDDVDVVVPPAYSCDEFEVAASTILECQNFIASGCPGVAPCDELEALYFASLADHRSLVELRSAWLRSAADAESATDAEDPEDAEVPTPSIH